MFYKSIEVEPNTAYKVTCMKNVEKVTAAQAPVAPSGDETVVQDKPATAPAAGGKCPVCGAAVPADGKFCPVCGAKL